LSLLIACLMSLWLAISPASAGPEWGLPPETIELQAAPAPPRDFVTVHGSFLRVHGAPHDRDTLLRLSQHGSTSVMALTERLRVPVGGTIHVFVATSDKQFREMQLGNAPTWADGTAYPSRSSIFLRTPSIRGGQATPIDKVLDHELVHILLGRTFHPKRPPTWLQEGIAQVMAGEQGPHTIDAIRDGTLSGGFIRMDDLARGFPSDPLRARLAYAESADLISFIQVSYGPDAVPMLIDELARGENIRAAVRRSTGDGLDEVNDAWAGRFSTSAWRAMSWSTLFREDVLFGFCGVMLGFGFLVRRKEYKRRLAEMEEEERRTDELLAALLAQHAVRSNPRVADPGDSGYVA
jgi:hypothetical protein